MSNLPFGIDISKHQGRSIDYTLMKQNTKFVAVRAGISWGYEDPVFAQSWRALKGHNRIAYHVLYPSQDVTRQVSWFFDILSRAGFDAETDRLAIDIELWQGMTPQQVTTATERMYDQITERTGREPIVYSGAWFTNSRMVISEKLKQVDWWLATYPAKGSAPGTEHPGPPLLPRGVTKWLIHQTSETGVGRNFGLPSGAIDTNRWNEKMKKLNEYFENKEDPSDPLIEEPLFRIKITTSPGYRYITYESPNGRRMNDSEWLMSGDEEEVFETRTNWYRISNNRWINGGFPQWVRVIEEKPKYVYFGPVFNQRDIRWKDIALGTKSTIGANGCLLNCVCMALCAIGINVNPKTLNEEMIRVKGYLNGNLFVWEKVEQIFPTVKFVGHEYRPTYANMREKVESNELPIIYVDFNNNTPEIEMHWVIGIGYDSTDIICADPWTGEIIKLRERYRNNIIRFGSYK